MNKTTIHEFLRHIESLVEGAGVCVYLNLSEAGRLHDFAGRWDVSAKLVGDKHCYLRSDTKKLLESAKGTFANQIADELGKMK